VRTGRGGRYQVSDLEPGKIEVKLNAASLPSGYRAIVSKQKIEVTAEPFRRADVDFPVRKSFRAQNEN